MREQLKHLEHTLQNGFDGDPWYGNSVWNIIEQVNFNDVNTSPIKNSNTIGYIVQHLLSWRTFVIEKLAGNPNFDIPMNSSVDWPKKNVESEEQWEILKQQLWNTQAQIIKQVTEMTEDNKLEEKIEGRQYLSGFLLFGIIEHDIYHAGQIAFIKQQLRNVNKLV